MERVVGISEMTVSGDPEDVLVTYSLGSCAALVLYDPVIRVAGLLHAMMPVSSASPDKAIDTPAMFSDTGTTMLLQAMFDKGSRRSDLIAKIVGASQARRDDDVFRIGERNYTVMRRVLWRNGVLVAAEDVGGDRSRTAWIDVDSGRVLVKSDGRITEL